MTWSETTYDEWSLDFFSMNLLQQLQFQLS